MNRYLRIVLVLCAVTPGCKPRPPKDQPRHPLLDGLRPPPVNRPLDAVPQREPLSKPQLPAGKASALLILREGAPFVGTLEASGQLSGQTGRLRLVIRGEPPLEVMYRLPPGLDSLLIAEGEGTVTVIERSTPGGMDQRLMVRREGHLLLGEIWQRSVRPLVLELGDGLQLSQRPTQPAGGFYTEVPLLAAAGKRTMVTIPIGKPTSITAAGVAFVVYVEVSHLATPSEADAGQVAGGYILHAWVVRQG